MQVEPKTTIEPEHPTVKICVSIAGYIETAYPSLFGFIQYNRSYKVLKRKTLTHVLEVRAVGELALNRISAKEKFERDVRAILELLEQEGFYNVYLEFSRIPAKKKGNWLHLR